MQVLNHSLTALVGAGRSSPGFQVHPMPKPIAPVPPFRPILPLDP